MTPGIDSASGPRGDQPFHRMRLHFFGFLPMLTEEKDFFELQSSPQLELRTSPSGFCRNRAFRQRGHVPSLGSRRPTAQLQHGDFFEHLSLVLHQLFLEEASLLMKRFVNNYACSVTDFFGDSFFFRAPSFSWRIYVRDDAVATDLSVHDHMVHSVLGIVVGAASVTEQVEEDDIELIPESPCFDAKIVRVRSSNPTSLPLACGSNSTVSSLPGEVGLGEKTGSGL